MKKLLTLLLILCVATTLFASGFSVNAGGAFDLFSLRTDTVTDSDLYYIFKGNGLGFDIGVQYDFSRKVMAYADFNMVFPSDFDMCATDGNISETTTYKSRIELAENYAKALTDGKASHLCFLLDASIGAAYKFDFDPIQLAVGGGVYVNLLRGSVGVTGKLGTASVDSKVVFEFLTVGVSTLIDAKYEINDNIAVRLAVMPQVGIFSKRDINEYADGKWDEVASLSGVAVSFTMPVTIGASYSF